MSGQRVVRADRGWPTTPGTTDRPGRRPHVTGSARRPLLTGYRGAPPVDTTAPEKLLSRVGRLAKDFPEIAELDLNPVLVGPDGAVAVDAERRLAPVAAEPDPVLRQLA